MEIRFLWKTANSATENCPALYETEGGYVVQGRTIDDSTRRQLRQLAEDETAVFVPSDVIDRIRGLA